MIYCVLSKEILFEIPSLPEPIGHYAPVILAFPNTYRVFFKSFLLDQFIKLLLLLSVCVHKYIFRLLFHYLIRDD
jgi:hypothetical protein